MKTTINNFQTSSKSQFILRLFILSYLLLHSIGAFSKPVGSPYVDINANDPKFDVSSIEIYKYHNNIINNIGTEPLDINGIIIQPGATDSILITNEELISLQSRDNSFLVQTRENQKPKIILQKMASMSSEDVSVSQLQKVIAFRVTISDDFASQLEFSINGPISYKVVKESEKQIVIDIKLDAYKSESDFNNYAQKDNAGKCKSIFDIIVKDKIAPHNCSEKGTFIYTEW